MENNREDSVTITKSTTCIQRRYQVFLVGRVN